MINPPEYTDGVFDLYRIKTEKLGDYPVEHLESQNLKVWYAEISVYDRVRYELGQGGIEVTMKIRIPRFKEIDSKCVCMIDGRQHRVYNAAQIVDKNGFPQSELTLIKPEQEVEVRD